MLQPDLQCYVNAPITVKNRCEIEAAVLRAALRNTVRECFHESVTRGQANMNLFTEDRIAASRVKILLQQNRFFLSVIDDKPSLHARSKNRNNTRL